MTSQKHSGSWWLVSWWPSINYCPGSLFPACLHNENLGKAVMRLSIGEEGACFILGIYFGFLPRVEQGKGNGWAELSSRVDTLKTNIHASTPQEFGGCDRKSSVPANISKWLWIAADHWPVQEKHLSCEHKVQNNPNLETWGLIIPHCKFLFCVSWMCYLVLGPPPEGYLLT